MKNENKESRFSFKSKNGTYPCGEEGLQWVSSFREALKKAESWDAESVIELREDEEGNWQIIAETPLDSIVTDRSSESVTVQPFISQQVTTVDVSESGLPLFSPDYSTISGGCKKSGTYWQISTKDGKLSFKGNADAGAKQMLEFMRVKLVDYSDIKSVSESYTLRIVDSEEHLQSRVAAGMSRSYTNLVYDGESFVDSTTRYVQPYVWDDESEALSAMERIAEDLLGNSQMEMILECESTIIKTSVIQVIKLQ